MSLDIIGTFKKARRMAAYMKYKFDFIGIHSPKRKEISKPFLAERFTSYEDFRTVIETIWLWDEREFQYLALELLHKNRKLLSIESIPFLENLVLNKSWWDTVDNLASKVIGLMLLRFPDDVDNVVRPWIQSEDLWLNRTAIIFQLKYKEKIRLDFAKLKAIEAHVGSKWNSSIKRRLGGR